MADKLTVTATPIVPGPHVYPHVDEIDQFSSQQTIRLLWDRLHDLTDRVTAAEGTTKALVTAHNAAAAHLTTVQKQSEATLAVAQRLVAPGTTGVGGSAGGSGSATPVGPVVSGGGSPTPPGGSRTALSTSGPGSTPISATIDGIPVIINGGSPDVSGWAKTTQLTAIDTSIMQVTFGKQNDPGRWPDVTPPGFGGPLQYTLWLFEQHSGQWYASGIIQYWFGRVSGSSNIACGNQLATNWTYDARWGPMAGYQPPPGETIGFMVTAGNQRGTNDFLVQERSNIVFLAMPTCGGTTIFPPYVSQT